MFGPAVTDFTNPLYCSMMSAAMEELSVIDELSVILMFLNPFLAKLPDEARENLCRRMSVQSINRDHIIYRQGEEVSNFYLILSGEPSSPMP